MEFILTKEQYQTMTTAWADHQFRHPTAAEHIIYNILRCKPLNRGFTPITNHNKIRSNCNDPHHAFGCALHDVYSATRVHGEYKAPQWTGIFLNIFKRDPAEQERREQQHRSDWETSKRAIEGRFKELFGLELTEELSQKIREATKGGA